MLLGVLYTSIAISQQTGYYNGVDGKDGDALKNALHEIIKGHTPYSYHSSKYVLKLSDADPAVPGNVILVYTGRSQDGDDYGTGGNFINREHVWAKSHGNFVDWLPMYSDVHNLKPCDASVNVDKSNKDFDNGGTQHSEATGCYTTDSTWEARDEVKGDVARIIFYMSTRYEGGEGEIDLEVVDHNNTYPYAEHGKLSTLLEWNLQDPPDEFERKRNNVIQSFQHNRNPFIDNPNLAQLIWAGETANPISIDNFQINPEVVIANEPVEVNVDIVSANGAVSSAQLLWGLSYEQLTNEIDMAQIGDSFSGTIPGQGEDATIYYQVIADDATSETESVVYNYYIPKVFTGTLVSIYDIQGQQDESPYDGQTVSTTGVITANFGTSYFLQDGTGLWNGLFIYESGRNPSIGDSVIITGKITEYYGKTEMSDITDYYFITGNNTLPEAVEVSTGDVEEGHESIVIKVTEAVCTDDEYQANFYMWAVNDGTGELKIHNTSIFEYEPTIGLTYDITGPLNYDFDEWKIELRYESDVVGSVDVDGPLVISAEPILSTNIKLMFDDDLDESAAEDINNYSIDKGVVVESVSQHAFNKSQVNLTVSAMSFDDYIVTIYNMKDESGNITVEQQTGFLWIGIKELFVGGEVEIYPNPADNQLNIKFVASENTDLEMAIIDISGRVILQQVFSASQGTNITKFDLSNISQGVYFLNIAEGSSSLKYKIIVK